MNARHRRWPVGVVAAATLLGLASGCTAEPASTSRTGTPPADATLTVALAGIPSNLDINPFGGAPAIQVQSNLNSTLFAYDTAGLAGHGCDQAAGLDAIVGNLVESATYSDDRLSITLKLKSAVSQWGNTLTAADVVWSLQRDLAISAIAKGLLTSTTKYDPVNPATAIDDRTVRLNLTSSSALDLAVLTNFSTEIVDSTEVKKHVTATDVWGNDWTHTNVADFGPWKLQSFTPGTEVVLVPNPNYTGKRGNITTLVMRNVPDASTRAQLVQTGDIDWAAGLSYSQFKSLQGKPGLTTLACKSPKRDNLLLNFKDARLSNVDVRQAISDAIDREALASGAYAGFATPSKFGISSAYDFTAPSQQYRYDPDEAKRLLAKAGYPNGFELELIVSTVRPGPVVTQSSVLLQSMLAKVGITVKLTNVASAADLSNLYFGKNFQALLYEEPPAVSDPAFSLIQFNASTSSNNVVGFKDPAFDADLAALAALPDGPARDALITKLAGAVIDEAPQLYLVDTPNLYVFSDRIDGFNAQPYGPFFPDQLTVWSA